MKKRLVYWFSFMPSQATKDKAALLTQKECDVRFFNELATLMTEFTNTRAPIIIFSDEGDKDALKKAMQRLNDFPEAHGVRFVLVTIESHAEIINTAINLGFRDIIAGDLDQNNWLRRFIFSTASSAGKLPLPQPMMTLSAMAAVNMPARLVWMSHQKMRIETKVQPAIGSRIQIAGPLATYFGAKSLTFTVESLPKTNLCFWFSGAIEGTWHVPEGTEQKRAILIDHLRKTGHGAGCRVYCIVQNPELRSQLLEVLTAPKFEVATALSRKSIAEEPKFFSPHIVFIEDQLCNDETYPYLKELDRELDPAIPLVVLNQEHGIQKLRSLLPSRRIMPLARIRPTLPGMILEKYLTKNTWRRGIGEPEDAYIINQESDFSLVEVTVAARVKQIHPQALQLALPMAVGNFGMCRLNLPFLSKQVSKSLVAKIHDSYDAEYVSAQDEFPHIINVSFGNALQADRAAIGQLMVDTLAKYVLAGGNKAAMTETSTTHPMEGRLGVPVQDAVRQIQRDTAKMRESIVEAVDQVAEEARKAVAEKVDIEETIRSLKPLLVFAAVSLIIIGIISVITFQVLPHWQHSGSNYSEQLKVFQSKTAPKNNGN